MLTRTFLLGLDTAFMTRIAGAAALTAALLIGSGLSAPLAQAAYLVTLTQEGPNVVVTGSGTIDLSALAFQATAPEFGAASMIPLCWFTRRWSTDGDAVLRRAI